VIEAQEPERVRAGVIAGVAAGTVALTALAVVLAWLLVAPAPAARYPVAAPSPLEHGLFDRATGGDDARRAGARRLERTEWIDRGARVVRIPIERAIDAVVADPSLIGGAR
jgi:hypothetical protein